MSLVTRYEQLARAIAEAYPALPNRLQGIARFALDNPDQMALSTVAEIARAAGVPPSAVIRFANALGFDGFLALQRVYRERLVARSATYRERIEALRKRGGGEQSILPQLVDSAIERARAAARARRAWPLSSRRDADPRARAGSRRWRSAARSRSRRTWPTGCRSSRSPHSCSTASAACCASRRRCCASGDLLIAASFRNYSPEVVEAASICHAQRACR